MPAHTTPRNILGDLRFDLRQMLDDLREAGVMLAHINRTRHSIDESIDLVQTMLAQSEPEWDGITERRRVPPIVQMMQTQASDEADGWNPRSVAA